MMPEAVAGNGACPQAPVRLAAQLPRGRWGQQPLPDTNRLYRFSSLRKNECNGVTTDRNPALLRGRAVG